MAAKRRTKNNAARKKRWAETEETMSRRRDGANVETKEDEELFVVDDVGARGREGKRMV
jgi:hypothetical protein